MTAAHCNVLVLSNTWEPLEIITWQDAILLVLGERADMIANYVGEFVRTVSSVFDRPAVIALRSTLARPKRTRFSRAGVLARDGYTCQYCGDRPVKKRKIGPAAPDIKRLTIDHVVPRARSVNASVKLPWKSKPVPVTSWENVVTCCIPSHLLIVVAGTPQLIPP